MSAELLNNVYLFEGLSTMEEDAILGKKLLWAFCRTLTRRLRDTNEKISSFVAMTVGYNHV